MKKISIRLKIVGLGLIVSIMALGVALVVSDTTYRRETKTSFVNDIDKALLDVQNGFLEKQSGQQSTVFYELSYNYIKDIYDKGGEEPESFNSYTDKRSFYKTKYKWAYPIDDFGMYLQTEEEEAFRDSYRDFTYTLRDINLATGATSTYFVTFDETNNRLIYIADDSSYIPNYQKEYNLPGTHVDNLLSRPEQEGEVFTYDYNGKTTRCIPIYVGLEKDNFVGYLMIEYNYHEINATANKILILEIITLSISSIVLILLFFVLSHFLLIRNLLKLSKASMKFTDSLKKNETLVVEDPGIKSRDEIKEVSDSMVSMEKEIIDYVVLVKNEAREKERMNAELSVASKIQLDSLPDSSYSDANCNIRTFLKTAKTVGGDFYDYFYLDRSRLLVTICDVSGKGVPAALFMMRGKELIKSNLKSGSSLEEAVFKANNDLIKNNDENLFITAFVGIVDVKKHEIKFVNCGHEKPYILSKDKVIKLDGASNFVLGGVEGFNYKAEKHAFNIDDRLFLFTDGLNEAINKDKEEFTYERIEKVLKDNIDKDNEIIINEMNASLNDFVGEEEVFDDVTMVLLRFKEAKIHLSYKEAELNVVQDIVEEFNKQFSFVEQTHRSEVGIIIDEAVTNIITYNDKDNLEFSVDVELEIDKIKIVFTDNGKKFNPLDNEDKYLEEYSDDIVSGGFGIKLIKQFSSEQKYEYKGHKNILRVYKNL